MVYKNGFKEYAVSCCMCTLIYGTFMGIFYHNLTAGIISGVIFGTLFTLVIVLMSKNLEKKSAYLRAEISKVRRIICEGPANHSKGLNAIAGWMFLSEDAIEFYAHKMNFGAQNVPILLDDIAHVEVKANKLQIHTKTGLVYSFVVNKPKLWQQSILQTL